MEYDTDEEREIEQQERGGHTRSTSTHLPLPTLQAGHDVHGVERQPSQEVKRVAGPLNRSKGRAAKKEGAGVGVGSTQQQRWRLHIDR